MIQPPTVNLLWTKTPNLGDIESAVLRHVSIQGRIHSLGIDPRRLSGHVVIVGGGGLCYPPMQHFLDRLLNCGASKLIAWGVGTNVSGDDAWYPRCLDRFDAVGVRDTGQRWDWVPCASCLSTEFDRPRSVKTDAVAYAHHERSTDCFLPDVPMMRNNAASMAGALDFLASGETVYTNSYHGAYWATLLGRRVVVTETWSAKLNHMRHPPARSAGSTTIYPDALEECRNANRQFFLRVQECV